MSIPSQAEVVIIGGGVAGCSVAYHLAKLGVTDVVVCERKQLASGTTWHAAGLVTQLRNTRNMTELAKYTGELFSQLEQETGQATGFKQNGALRVAITEHRFEELKRNSSMAQSFGLESYVVSPGEVKERWPLMEVGDIAGAIWMPKDGQVNPLDVTAAMAKGARSRGVKVVENIAIERILVENGRVHGVAIEGGGEIRAKTVVIAGGMWSRDLAAAVGVSIPLHGAEHSYIVTEAIEGLPRDLPVMINTDEWAYFKEDAGKLLVGAFEPVAKPWGHEGISKDFCFDSLPFDFGQFEEILEKATKRVPILEKTGIQLFFTGPESFTPDNIYLLGETSEVDGLFCACGFNSAGILSSGGVGKALASWIVDGHPPMDLSDVDIKRTQPFQSNRKFLHDRTKESLGLLYQMHWPNRQFDTARNVRRSPFHDKLLAQGAFMTSVGGFERPGFFDRHGAIKEIKYSYGHQNWFEAAAEECRNTASAVTLFDQSSFAVFRVEGLDACAQLNNISANDVDVPVGKIVYTQWLNERGGIEADVTVTRIAPKVFLIVTGVAAQNRDFRWLVKHLDPEARVVATDVSAGYTTLALMGPNSRALLSRISGEAITNENFPFGTCRQLEIGYARALACRMTFVGELGWELYIPTDFALHVFEEIQAVGGEYGLMNGGYFAINSMRMEKGYRHWGHDIGGEDTPLEAGLNFAVAYQKRQSFIGRDAVCRQLETEKVPSKRLVHLRIEGGVDAPLVYDGEPIVCQGKIIGAVTSGAYGHRIGASLGLAYVNQPDGVTQDWLSNSKFEVEVARKRYAASLQLRPFYDPTNSRVKAHE